MKSGFDGKINKDGGAWLYSHHFDGFQAQNNKYIQVVTARTRQLLSSDFCAYVELKKI